MAIDARGPFTCPVEASIALVGGKYKAALLWHLMAEGPLRYSELHRRLPRATDKMLAQQLRELEADGLVARRVYPTAPPKTEYRLTDAGASLGPVLDALCAWGEAYLARRGRASCGGGPCTREHKKSGNGAPFGVS